MGLAMNKFTNEKNAEVEVFGGFAMQMCDARYPKNRPNFGISVIKKIKKYPNFFYQFENPHM